MKKSIKVLIAVGIISVFGITSCLSFNAKILKSLSEIENADINMGEIADGEYTGHSEMGPVSVDVKVTVENHWMKKVDLVRHDCGLGHPADVIVTTMEEQNTWDVDAISGATVSSEIIKNAVNKALTSKN